jgi:hypothetical protein
MQKAKFAHEKRITSPSFHLRKAQTCISRNLPTKNNRPNSCLKPQSPIPRPIVEKAKVGAEKPIPGNPCQAPSPKHLKSKICPRKPNVRIALPRPIVEKLKSDIRKPIAPPSPTAFPLQKAPNVQIQKFDDKKTTT